jgi:hypothetical protein
MRVVVNIFSIHTPFVVDKLCNILFLVIISEKVDIISLDVHSYVYSIYIHQVAHSDNIVLHIYICMVRKD